MPSDTPLPSTAEASNKHKQEHINRKRRLARVVFFCFSTMFGRGENGEERRKRPYTNNGTRFTASAINPQ